MKKTLIVSMAAAFAALSATALDYEKIDTTGYSPERLKRHQEIVARHRQRVAERGGYVTQAVTSKVIRIVSAQKIATKGNFEDTIANFTKALNIPVDWIDAEATEKCGGKLAALGNKDGRCGAALVLVDDPDAPALLVAPENFWAVVNVGKLNSDKPDAEKLERRLRQEFWRALGMVLGAYASNYQPCVMTILSGNESLDKNVAQIPAMEVLPKMQQGARSIGIRPARRAYYDKACEEGWAPAPTNDVQKAIWERVKADKERGPSNPMRIKPPRK